MHAARAVHKQREKREEKTKLDVRRPSAISQSSRHHRSPAVSVDTSARKSQAHSDVSGSILSTFCRERECVYNGLISDRQVEHSYVICLPPVTTCLGMTSHFISFNGWCKKRFLLCAGCCNNTKASIINCHQRDL